MQLAAVSDLRGQIGFDDMTDINTAIGDALDAAETQLAAILRTEFSQVTVTDTFYIEDSPRTGRSVRNEILLSRGFLSAQPTTVITNSISPVFLTAWDIVQANYGGQAGPLPNFIFDLPKGHGMDTTNFYEATYLQVGYQAGFPPDGSNPDQYLLTGPGSVPQWLQQAAKIMALINLADSAVLTASNIMVDKKLNQQQLQLLVQPKIRYKPLALDPFTDPVFVT
jgi:hypothetical protein